MENNNSLLSALEEKIYMAIASAPSGIKGGEIAAQIGEEKKTVNSTLYRSDSLKALVVQGEDYCWRLREGTNTMPKEEISEPDTKTNDVTSNLNETLLNKTITDWENALLDLGKRNKMISYKSTGTLTIVEPAFRDLYDAIVSKDKNLSFQRDVDQNIDPRVYSLVRLLGRMQSPIEVTVGDIKVKGSVADSRRVLKNLRAKAKVAQDEQGLNILYLVFGFLNWRDNGSHDYTRSPLLLVPVTLTVDSINAPFRLKKYDDDILVNPALDKYFRDEFNMSLPDFDPDSQTLDDFMDAIKELVDLKGWYIEEETGLGLFSFAKVNMYRDLQENEERIKAHPIIRALVGEENGITHNEEYFKQFDHDSEPAQDTYQVVDADSSQKDAIELSKRGVSFVLQGPPGTGKSQTITNIIAEGLAAKKKILFVSEKMAALDVVYRRLTEVGLADFCLPLHDHKANKKDIIRQIGSNLELSADKVNVADLVKLEDLNDIRKHLKNYVKDIHEVISPLDMSLYGVFGEFSALKGVPDITLHLDKVESYSKAEMARIGQDIVKYAKLYKKQGVDWRNNPWNGIGCNYLSGNQKLKLREHLANCIESISNLHGFELGGSTVGDIFTLQGIYVFGEMLNMVKEGINLKEFWKDDDVRAEAKLLVDSLIDHCKSLNELGEKYKALVDEIGLTLQDRVDYTYFADLKFAAEPIKEFELLLGNAYNEKFIGFLAELEQNQIGYNEVQEKIKEKCNEIGVLEHNWMSLINIIDEDKDVISRLTPTNGWAYHYAESDELVKDVESKSEELRSIKERLVDNYGAKVLEFDVDSIIEWLKVHRYDFMKLFDTVIAEERTCRELLGLQLPQISNFLDELERKSIEYKNAVAEITRKRRETRYIGDDNKAFENFCRNEKQKFISVKPASVWCNNCGRVSSLLNELISIVNNIKTVKADLLKLCNKEVLDLDYAAMLGRFKTEYNGAFFGMSKLFNGQYKQDIKTLKSVYKTAKSDFTNDEVIEVLQKVKGYHDGVAEYRGKESAVKSIIGINSYDLDYDWENVKYHVAVFEEIARNFESQEDAYSFISEKKYNDYLDSVEHFEEIRKWETNNNGSKLLGVRYEGYRTDVNGIRNDLSYIEKLLAAFKDNTVPKQTLQGDGLINLLNNVKAFQEDSKNYFAKSDDIKKLLNISSYDIGYDWSELHTQLTCFGRLLKLFSEPSKIFGFLAKDKYFSVMEIYEEFSKLDAWEKKCNGDNYLGSYYEKYDTDIAAIRSNILLLDKNRSLFDNNSAYIAFVKDEDRYHKVSVLQDLYSRIASDNDWLTARKSDIDSLLDTDSSTEIEYWDNVKENLDAVDTIMNAMDNDLAVALLKNDKKSLNNLKALVKAVCENKPSFEAIGELFSEQKSGEQDKVEFLDMRLDTVMNRFQACVDNFVGMDEWIDFRDCRNVSVERGLEHFIDSLCEDCDDSADALKVFEKAFYRSWLERIVPRFSSVYRFNHDQHIEDIDTFSSLDRQQLTLARKRIKHDLVASMPQKGTQRGEMDILTKEMYKRSKIMSIRKLFGNIPNLLQALKPCLMMSPLSVAYFLDANKYSFDMVIFDEASQIFPEDAIGAIIRGKQVIIAGDSKQMPPTNFFKAGTTFSDDYDYDDENMEDVKFDSILEGADNRLHSCTLRWHYRSLNEELIAFSNMNIYNGELVTFPATSNRLADTGVEYIYVEDGLYDKQRNIPEAKAIVRIILEHIEKYPDRSLGVIAFSTAQQSAIEDALESYRKKHKLPLNVEKFFDENKEEPFFIKNLENVQGDERDTIIFSICYAKNKQGKMLMRFGPLGRAGGERRLNVAITRAKLNVKLVGSIDSYDIDLSRMKKDNEGVKLLKQYIEFAKNGVAVLPEVEGYGLANRHDMFVDTVADFLKEKGYGIIKNVGSSSYTIDMAVQDPSNPNKYIAGIECDGLMYFSSKTVRDRDALKPSVLKRMGWNLYRVWSTAWMRNPELEQRKLLEFLGDDKENATDLGDRPVEMAPTTDYSNTDVVDAPDLFTNEPALEEPAEFLNETAEQVQNLFDDESGYSETVDDVVTYETDLEQVNLIKDETTESNLFDDSFNSQTVSAVDNVENSCRPEADSQDKPNSEKINTGEAFNEYGMPYYKAFDSSSYVICSDLKNPYALADLITEVVRIEQPVHFDVVCKRIAPLLGYVHINAELLDLVDMIVSNYAYADISQSNGMLYINDCDECVVRCSRLGNPDREFRFIPIPEIQEAVRIVMKDQQYLSRAKLNNTIGQIFGYTRLTSLKDKNIISEVVDQYILQGSMRKELGMLHWMED